MPDTTIHPLLLRTFGRTASVGLAIAMIITSVADSEAQVSRLWGREGEAWSSPSRLPDFSFAGYRRGEEPYRIPRQNVSIQSFGAKGDGQTDDTAAFRRAIAAGEGKVIVVPAGRYLLSDMLEIRQSNLVLRGAGSGKTVLLFSKPLEELRPRAARTDGGKPTTGWSWGGGLITVGDNGSTTGSAVRVASDARRGETALHLETNPFAIGDEVVLGLRDDKEQSLLRYLYRGTTGNISGLRNWNCRQVFRVTATSGDKITLDRSLRFDVRKAWNPTVGTFTPTVTDVGLEGLTFEFPQARYGGHFQELGYNPVEIGSSAAHCWLRDIAADNADSGPYVRGTFCTLEKIRLTADRPRESSRGHTGHHGITFYGHDSLCTDFSIETRFIHDLTVQSAMGCVFASGRAIDLSMDHHRWAPYENLFTDIDAGEGTRLFSSSGGGNRGLHTAAGATFWNIRSKRSTDWPSNLGIEAINVVALPTKTRSVLEPDGRWLEAIAPDKVQPANLYQAMLQKRLRDRSD